MSGGEWNYAYMRIDEIANKLLQEKNIKRKILGVLMQKLSKALHDIEWVDSEDYGKGDDTKEINEVLNFSKNNEIAKILIEELKSNLKEANEFLRKIRKLNKGEIN